MMVVGCPTATFVSIPPDGGNIDEKERELTMGERKRKKSIILLISAILGVLYALYIVIYFFAQNTTQTDAVGAIGAGLATALVLPHMLCAVLAAIFNTLGWAMGKRGFALTGAILYAVAMVLFLLYAPLVLIQTILSFIGFATMKNLPYIDDDSAPSSKPKLTIRTGDMMKAPGMIEYCFHYDFNNGMKRDDAFTLFSRIEQDIQEGELVFITFIGNKDSGSSQGQKINCAYALTASKFIYAWNNNGSLDVETIPAESINGFEIYNNDAASAIIVNTTNGPINIGVRRSIADDLFYCVRAALDLRKNTVNQ